MRVQGTATYYLKIIYWYPISMLSEVEKLFIVIFDYWGRATWHHASNAVSDLVQFAIIHRHLSLVELGVKPTI